MPTLSRSDIFAQAARRMRADFEALIVVPHNATKGQEAEEIIRQFLNGHLPKRFTASAGFITDPMGAVSNQTDVIIYDSHNCPVYRASDTAGIFPSNNVAVVVEVKSRLNGDEVKDAAAKIARIKAMTKSKPPDLPFRVAAQTLGVLFAFASDITLSKTMDHYVESIRTNGLGRHIDFIAILDRGLVTLCSKFRGLTGWNVSMIEGLAGKAAEGAHIAASAAEFGENTLDVFLRLLLPHLSNFRQIVDHPGFDFSSLQPENQMLVQYLFSHTNEVDPKKRAQKLAKYSEEVRAELARTPAPKSDA
jgi:hypothetical protein